MTPLLVEGNALAAMTLMIALSAPAGKDTMIALVENFLIRHESQEINLETVNEGCTSITF